MLRRESPNGQQICLHQRQHTGVMDSFWVCPGWRMATAVTPMVRRPIAWRFDVFDVEHLLRGSSTLMKHDTDSGVSVLLRDFLAAFFRQTT